MLFLSADRLIAGPTGNEQRRQILPQARKRFQAEKRRMVGGPFAASSGGMSDVRSLEQEHPSPDCSTGKDNQGTRRQSTDVLRKLSEMNGEHSTCSELPKCYLLGTVRTRAETAEFFSVPPRTSGPSGVNTIPRVSARTS